VITALWRGWVRLIATTESGYTLAALRMAVAAAVLLTLGPMVWLGVDDVLWNDVAHGGHRSGLRANHLLELLGGVTPANVHLLEAVCLGGAALMFVGLGGRLTPLVVGQAWLALERIHPQAGGSYQTLLDNACWLLVLSNSTATWSLDCRIRSGRWSSERLVAAWPRWLFITQLAVVYVSTALQKQALTWSIFGGYTAVWYAMTDPDWYRFVPPGLAWLSPLLALGTFGTWYFEAAWGLIPLLLWARRRGWPGWLARLDERVDLRVPATMMGLALHGGIALFLEVATFSITILSFYLALWRPAEIRRGVAWLGERLKLPLRRARPAGEAPAGSAS
jgi:hypothetical protein